MKYVELFLITFFASGFSLMFFSWVLFALARQAEKKGILKK